MTIIDRGLICVLACLAANVAAQPVCTVDAPRDIEAMRREVERRLAPAPRAIPRVHTEGTLPHQGIWDQSVEAEQDWPAMRELALLWKSGHAQADLVRLAALLTAWGTVYIPSFNPIDETNLDAFIDAYAIAAQDLPEPAQHVAKDWIRRIGTGYLDRMEHGAGSTDGRWSNNWNAHRVKLAALAAAALNDGTMWARARRQFVAHLGRNIRADGSTVDFEQRDALHYVTYDLTPLVRAALTARERGEDWLSVKGANHAGLRDALNWLAPYAVGEVTHEEFAHSSVPFDDKRRAAGVAGYKGKWDPDTASALFALASWLDPAYEPVSRRLKRPGGWIAWCARAAGR